MRRTDKTKLTARIAVAVGAIIWITIITMSVYADYQYNKNIYSYWSLADKSSTLDAKSENMDRFVSALESENLNSRRSPLDFVKLNK